MPKIPGDYDKAAEMLGWRVSHAHGGLINDRYRDRPNTRPNEWASYRVADNAEEACFWEGIETLEQAGVYVRDQHRRPA